MDNHKWTFFKYYEVFCFYSSLMSRSAHRHATLMPLDGLLQLKFRKRLSNPLSTKQSSFEITLLLCFVFGGKCKICSRDIVRPCVTSASPRRRDSRACTGTQEPIQKTKQYNQWLLNKERRTNGYSLVYRYTRTEPEIAHNFDEKESFGFLHNRTFTWKKHAGNRQREKTGRQ